MNPGFASNIFKLNVCVNQFNFGAFILNVNSLITGGIYTIMD
jgi:hypothetical protein